jgi:hypothetical protein
MGALPLIFLVSDMLAETPSPRNPSFG